LARNDPTDTGGLFIGRRPGTAKVRYAADPSPSPPGRRRLDALFAFVVLVFEAVTCLSVWGPQPVGWLWVGSQLNYRTGSVSFGIAAAFVGMMLSLMATLAVAARLDALWKVVRRAAGHDQQEGILVRIFTVTAIVAALGFGFWLLIIQGPGPILAPSQ
jgi:hypothetical protein